jgi:hypothetical protein
MLERSEAHTPLPPPVEGETRPVAFRGAGFAPKAGRYAGWIALVLVIALWQLAGSAGFVNPLFLPTPVAIARAIYQLALSGALWKHLSYSIMRIGTGWILGTSAGVIVGFAIGLSSLARGVGITFISALFPIPKIALLPLLILWLGIGEEPKIATIETFRITKAGGYGSRLKVGTMKDAHAFPRSSLNRSSFCCTGRSEKLNSTESSSASWVTHCQLGTTNRSRGPHSKVCSPIRERPLPSIAANTVASVER